jgi:hypothetical protein
MHTTANTVKGTLANGVRIYGYKQPDGSVIEEFATHSVGGWSNAQHGRKHGSADFPDGVQELSRREFVTAWLNLDDDEDLAPGDEQFTLAELQGKYRNDELVEFGPMETYAP